MTSNPLDDLRQINRDQRNAQDTPVSTALREAINTEGRPAARAEGLPSLRPSGSQQGSNEARESVLTSVLPEVRQEALPSLREDVIPDLREAVRETVGQRRIYQGGVKATIDLAPELSTRFKRYSIDHSNVTLRQILTELLDAYLAGEGY